MILMLSLLLMVGPLGAANPEDGFKPAAIIELQSHRLAAYSSDSTPEEQVRYWLQHAYMDPVPERVLYAGSIDEMIRSLNDPYTSFMTPEEYDSFVSPGVIGIGIYIESVPQGILVKSLIPGSPAEEGGLQSGDIIIRVKEHQEENWISLAGLSTDQGGSLIRGPAGSQVDLTIIRGEQLLQFTFTRKKVEIPPVVTSLPDPATACIDLNTFLNSENQPSTASLFAEALQDMESQGAQGYILDLRDNGGGYVYNALDISGFFIGDKPAMQVRPLVTSDTALKHELLITKPVVVLINQNTASASEILSGALKDYNCALFLGQTTYGKGCMQSAYPIFNQGKLYGYLKMTTARYFTPLGYVVDQTGINPDITINQSDPLLAARLLLSATVPSSSGSNSSMVKLINGNQEYRIDINRAQQQEYWPVYNEIIDHAGSTRLMLPDSSAWTQASPEQLQAKWPLYYPGYHPFPTVNKHPGESITISFSHDVDPASIYNQAIELREKESGKSIDLNFQLKNEKELQLTPQKPLQPDQEYWLIVHPGANGVRSHDQQIPLSTGYITIIMVPGT
ncbi:C-terminal processing peptidase [Syntrophomonas wolfei subsp. wolfei str. Goettingen G311]|uniref:C-terminal processing peptidase n=2 Tax=Syntrophomonas wolfei TaxID=863 RepID=Q0B0I4_SYNWW|nr:C-terminal processing peptidase [Syntrophomonas wolfei subsp. wolfei str. Goettingen G311]